MENLVSNRLLDNIRTLLVSSRQQLQQTINTTMVQTYWNIGRLIVEEEQNGQNRAEYGSQQLEYLAQRLQMDFGRGFDVRNLRNMRRFYLVYPIWNAVRTELGWTHHRILTRIENKNAREWYANESIINQWSYRALERQISTLYYERLLSSKDKHPVAEEANDSDRNN